MGWCRHRLLLHADKLTHLYTLVIRKDNTFSVYIDGESVKDSSLLSGMTPPINPPKVRAVVLSCGRAGWNS